MPEVLKNLNHYFDPNEVQKIPSSHKKTSRYRTYANKLRNLGQIRAQIIGCDKLSVETETFHRSLL